MQKEIKLNVEELQKINIIEQFSKGQIEIEECCKILNLSKRQIYRLKKKNDKEGSISIIHGLKGKKIQSWL